MPKRKGQKKDNNEFQNQKKIKGDEYDIKFQNALFERYYQIQFDQYIKNDESMINKMFQSLHDQLPVVFRVNKTIPNSQHFVQSLPQDLIKKIDYFDNIDVYQCAFSRYELKKNEKYDETHKKIVIANECGLITRQEIVSMLPPFLMGGCNGLIWDSCAAPGSKTQQILEMIQNSDASGAVVANDVDVKRAYLLIHQLHRSNSNKILVTAHCAQHYPSLFTGEHTGHQKKNKINEIKFDKILCDVPCSGDGTARKACDVWQKWSTENAITLHPLQSLILHRGINLCKEGGIIVYSTCSLNPIEDESVIASI